MTIGIILWILWCVIIKYCKFEIRLHEHPGLFKYYTEPLGKFKPNSRAKWIQVYSYKGTYPNLSKDNYNLMWKIRIFRFFYRTTWQISPKLWDLHSWTKGMKILTKEWFVYTELISPHILFRKVLNLLNHICVFR